MLTWISLSVTLIGSFATVALKSRAYVLAFLMWRESRDPAVLREVYKFERGIK